MPVKTVVDSLFSLENLPIAASFSAKPACGQSVAALLRAMDEAGIDRAVLGACRQWRCDKHWVCADVQTDDLLPFVQAAPSRLAGLAAYNPHAIAESLQQIETSVLEWGFRGVYIHCEGSEVGLRDRAMYPLYALCVRLGVPIMAQAGCHGTKLSDLHELVQIASDFPELKIVAVCCGSLDAHLLQSIAEHDDHPEREPQIFFSFSGAAEEIRDEELCRLLNHPVAGARCMWTSNSRPWKPLLNYLGNLPLPDDARTNFLFRNAARIFRLDAAVAFRTVEVPITVAER